MPLDAKTLERKFEEKSEEVQRLQEHLRKLQEEAQQTDALLKEGIGELKSYQKLFQEFFEDQPELILPDTKEEEDASDND